MTGITKLQVGEQVDQFLLIKEAKKGVTTVGKPFMSQLLLPFSFYYKVHSHYCLGTQLH